MSTTIKKTKTEHLQDIINRYVSSVKPERIDMREVAGWAIRNNYWEPARRDAINQCSHDLARAARDEFFEDAQGRNVRKKHALRLPIFEEGEQRQQSLWIDIETASTEDMHLSLQQRRGYIVGDCKQLKTDLESYNENYNKGKSIQLSFDFTEDVEEAAMGTEYPEAPPEDREPA